MDNMLGKVVRLLVTVREDYLATLSDLLEKLTGKDGVIWMKNLRLFLRKEQVDWSKKVGMSFLRVVASRVHLDLTPSTKTADRFKTQSGFAHRDSNIDMWMTERIPAGMGGSVICYELNEDGHTFMEIAHELLLLETPDGKDLTIEALIKQGKTFSLKHVEELHQRFMGGETKIGFNTNGNANFFLVHDEKGRVFVLNMVLHSVGWFVVIFNIRYGRRFCCGHRLFSRNGPPQKI